MIGGFEVFGIKEMVSYFWEVKYKRIMYTTFTCFLICIVAFILECDLAYVRNQSVHLFKYIGG